MANKNENAVVNTAPTTSETPSNLVADKLDLDFTQEELNNKLSPNPAGFGFTSQRIVDALPANESAVKDCLYLLKVTDNGVLVGYRGYKWTKVDGYTRAFISAPNFSQDNGYRGTPKVASDNEPKVKPDQVITGLVNFNVEPTIKGKKITEFIDLSGGVTKEELDAAVAILNNEINTKQDELNTTSAPEGDAIKLLGFDSDGNVVSDSIPEGITVDQSVINGSENAVAGGAVYTALQGKADVGDSYTKAEEDELLAAKADITALQNGTLVPAKSLVSEQLENVSEESGTTQNAPFLFQATATNGGAGASDTAPTAKYLKLFGKTYALNQLAYAFNSTNYYNENGKRTFDTSNNSSTFTADGTETSSFRCYTNSEKTLSIVSGHKYLIKFKTVLNTNATLSSQPYGIEIVGGYEINFDSNITNGTFSAIFTPNVNASGRYIVKARITSTATSGDTWTIQDLMIIDLTQLVNGNTDEINLFTNGVTLSDYDLTFSGVDLFNQLFPLPYYAYNTGILVSANATKLTTLGKNQFDKSTVVSGKFIANDGTETTNSSFAHSDYIRVIPSQVYKIKNTTANANINMVYCYDGNKNFIGRVPRLDNNVIDDFVIPSNAQYVIINMTTDDVDSQCFFIAWLENGTTSRPGYEEYVKHEYQLGDELKTAPLLSAGSVADEKTPDGTITRRVGTYTFTGSESFADYIGGGWSLSIVLNGIKGPSTSNDKANVIWALGITLPVNSLDASSPEYTIGVNKQGRLYIVTTKNSSELASALTGKTIYFEKVEYTTEVGTPFAEIVEVDDFGTMGYGGADFNGYPQGCSFFYPADYVLFIDSLGNTTDWDASNVVLDSELSAVDNKHDNLYAIMQENVGGALRHQLADKASIDFADTDFKDLGDYEWVETTNDRWYFNATNIVKYPGDTTTTPNCICPKYKTVKLGDSSTTDLSISVRGDGNCIIHDSSLSGKTVTEVQTALKGILLAYEKASE